MLTSHGTLRYVRQATQGNPTWQVYDSGYARVAPTISGQHVPTQKNGQPNSAIRAYRYCSHGEQTLSWLRSYHYRTTAAQTSLTSTRQVYVHDSITYILIAQYCTSTTVQNRGFGVPERCYQTSLDLSFSNYIGTGRMSFHGTRANESIQGRRTRTLLSVIAGYDAF